MAIKQRPDSPTNNFATLNPLDDDFDSSVTFTYGDGNLKTSYSFSNAAFQYVFGSLAIPSNSTKKYYWEWTYNDINNNAQHQVGICAIDSNQYTPSARTTGTVKEANVGTLRYHSTSQAPYLRYITLSSATSEGTQIGTMSTSATYNNLSVLSLMYDAGAGKLYGWLNGEELAGQSLSSNTSLWDTFDTTKTYMIMMFEGDGGTSTKNGWLYLNFGQDPTFGGNKNTPATVNSVTGPFAPSGDAEGTAGLFYYPPPADALALCSANLPEMTTTVDDDVPKDYFKTVTWTGQTNVGVYNNGNVTVGFQPDLVWVKKTTATSNHFLVDSVSGANKELNSNNTNAQSNNTGGIQSFNSSSFTVGADGGVNGSSETYVAWCWKAGGAPTADNSNTSGAMTANSVSLNGTLQSNYTPAGSPTIYPKRMSINTNAGFSIIKWVGNNTNNATIPHGLTKEPDFVIIKNTTDTTTWIVKLNPNTNPAVSNEQQYLYLNLNNPFGTNTGEETQLTSNTIKFVGTGLNNTNGSNDNMIAYCWHSVEGYSKFGSYIGNGSTDGPFVFTEFKPAWVLIKRVSASDNWSILDNQRPTYNPAKELIGNNDLAEPSNGYVDLVSNGIKIRLGDNRWNGSGSTYIYMAIAEQPFNYATAR